MEQAEILDHFKQTNALLDGHFQLSSGLHSPRYLQCALALQAPVDAMRYGQMLARELTEKGMAEDVRAVASPAIGGLVIGFAVAEALGTRFLWTERQNGEMVLRRGFTIAPGDRLVVVEDVITTGGSTRECISALKSHGAEIISAASIIDRSNGTADVGVRRVSLVSLEVSSYQADSCPLCRVGSTATKPGSRV